MSVALPDRYGKSEINPNHVITNNFLVTVGIVVSACGVAVMASSIIVKTGEFYSFANYALDLLQQTQFVVYVGYGALVLGFCGILTGFAVALSGLFASKNSNATYFAMFLLLACAAGNIAAGAVISNGVKLLDDAIYSTSTTPAPIGSFTQNVTHFQIAMFNGCCASQGAAYSKEIYTGIPGVTESPDMDGFVKYCDDLNQYSKANLQTSNSPRSCYRDQGTYRDFNYSVGLNLARICLTLTNAAVNIAGKKVPGTTIDVTAFTDGDNIVPVVGPFAKPFYGCGIGYAKAFQAAMLIWAENIIQPVATAFIACGAVYCFLFLLAMVTFYACSREKETAEERYVRYLEEINSSSQAANNNGGGPQVADSFEQPNPNRMSVQAPLAPSTGSNRNSVQNPNRLSVQSYATHSSQTGYQQQQQEFNFNVDDKI